MEALDLLCLMILFIDNFFGINKEIHNVDEDYKSSHAFIFQVFRALVIFSGGFYSQLCNIMDCGLEHELVIVKLTSFIEQDVNHQV